MKVGTTIGNAVERIPLAGQGFYRLRRALRRWRGRASVVDHVHDYAKWVRRHDTLSRREVAELRDAVDALMLRPRISIVMPVYNTPLAVLDAAIHSVRLQIYPDWQLCIADDASSSPGIREVLERHAAADDRIAVRFLPQRGNIVAATNAALELATGDFMALFDHDDILPAHALYWVVDAINRRPDACVIYSDEDKIDAAGRRYDPYFKGDFNLDLLRAQNMISHLGVYRRELVTAIGGFRAGFDGAQDHDFALRAIEQVRRDQIVHIPRILYHWRAIRGSAALNWESKPAAVSAGHRAVIDHLRRIGSDATVEPAPESPLYHRVRHPLPAGPPLASIVICTRDHEALLRTAIGSIQTRTNYGNYEIVVCDNGSVDAGMRSYLAEIACLPGVTVFRDDSPFNYSRLNNAAVAKSRGELVCLLNDDIEVLTPEWLDELASFAVQPDVGAVGARLWYPDGTLQHGGVIIGVGGVAGHAHLRLPKGCHGYFSRAVLQQELSAVTGACLMVRRAVFDAVGGLDERIAVAFNDVDFCLRLRAAGYRNIWTPFAELVHHESASRGQEDNPEKVARFQREVRFMHDRWGDVLQGDPHYNPNLSMATGSFTLARRRSASSARRAA
ncbi:MAG: glycosyltransferase family 2 protein [Planctomycetia bacterium]